MTDNLPAVIAPSLVPQNMGEAMKLAEMMATARLVPATLQNSPADCLLVLLQSIRWNADPFAVAQETSLIKRKDGGSTVMYSGKLVAAIINASGALNGRLTYTYNGQGDNLSVTVTGHLKGEEKPRVIVVRWIDAKTDNPAWFKQREQQLAYHGARVWARRHIPERMLGIWSPEEFDPDEAPPHPPYPASKAEEVVVSDPASSATILPPARSVNGIMDHLVREPAPPLDPRDPGPIPESLRRTREPVVDAEVTEVNGENPAPPHDHEADEAAQSRFAIAEKVMQSMMNAPVVTAEDYIKLVGDCGEGCADDAEKDGVKLYWARTADVRRFLRVTREQIKALSERLGWKQNGNGHAA